MRIQLITLKKLYIKEKKSVSEIAFLLHCSECKVNYWMKKYGIPKRSISEAMYLKNNPDGDPFKIKNKLNKDESKLCGLGLGLYWGEGNKRNKNSIKIGNTEPRLIRKFMDFLVGICGVDRKKISFSLTIFRDINPIEAKNFWTRELDIDSSQIRGKITTIKLNRIGTYKRKSEYGVLILQYHNTKLRNKIINMIDDLE